jgi:hypothetical protein
VARGDGVVTCSEKLDVLIDQVAERLPGALLPRAGGELQLSSSWTYSECGGWLGVGKGTSTGGRHEVERLGLDLKPGVPGGSGSEGKGSRGFSSGSGSGEKTHRNGTPNPGITRQLRCYYYG